MSEEIINQAIEAAPSPTTEPEVAQPVDVNTSTEATESKEDATEQNEPSDIPFPKKAINALSRRDKQIGKLQAQLAAERAELAKYREQQNIKPNSNATGLPKEEAYDNYGEYIKAVAKYEAQQELSQKQQEQENQKTQAELESWHAERTNYATEKAQKAIETIPDYKQTFMEHADILQSLPPHIERAFYEADEPALAFYALAKEGRLEEIMNMSAARAAIEIGRAEIRGEALAKQKPVTRAPQPIEGLKGGGGSSANKSLETMNSRELLEWVRKK